MMRSQKKTLLCMCSVVATLLVINTTCPLYDFLHKAQSSRKNAAVVVSAVFPSTTEHAPNERIHAGETKRLKKANDALPWLSHPMLPRLLSRQERDRCIELLSTVDVILREFNLTYLLSYGTLLGSYVMHDMLPWDDDLDIFMNIDDLPKMKRLFNTSRQGHYKQIQLLEKETGSGFPAKLYFLMDPKAGKYPWHWPFIDIEFYTEKITYVSPYKKSQNWRMKLSDFFPLKLRPLAGRWFPAPRNTSAFIASNYKHFVCKSHHWDHKNEVAIKRVHSADCKQLASHYPFVERKLLHDKMTETFMLNGKLQYSLILE